MTRVAGTLNTANGLYYPIIKIDVSVAGAGSFSTDALVDSGADYTTIPASLIDSVLNIPWSSLAADGVAFGVGGQFGQRKLRGEVRWKSRVVCREFKVVETLTVAVVGREDFFSRFTVDFNPWTGVPPSMLIARR